MYIDHVWSSLIHVMSVYGGGGVCTQVSAESAAEIQVVSSCPPERSLSFLHSEASSFPAIIHPPPMAILRIPPHSPDHTLCPRVFTRAIHPEPNDKV